MFRIRVHFTRRDGGSPLRVVQPQNTYTLLRIPSISPWLGRLPPLKRFVLALYKFRFSGVSEYLEDLVTRIDAPQLYEMYTPFLNQINFDCPRLAQFINCTPMLRAFHQAHVEFHDSFATVTLTRWPRVFEIATSCSGADLQLSSVAQVCNSSLPPPSTATVEDLYIEHYSQLVWPNDAVENTLWLQLLLPFTAVKNLYVCRAFAPGIAAALQELVGARITEVLPSLQNIFVEGLEPSGPFQKNIGQFVAARQLSDHPVTISAWS